MEMKDEFLFKTHMLDKNGEKTGVDQIADYMFRADMIYRMKRIGHGTAGAYLNCTGAGREI